MPSCPASAPPSPPGLPIAGHAFALAGDVGPFFVRQYQRLGPVFRVRAFGRRFPVLAGPEANLFVTRSGAKHLRSKEAWSDFDAELGARRSLVSMDGPDHLRMRSAQQPGYSRSLIHSRLDEVVAITRRHVAAWPLDRPVPALPALQRIVTEQLGTLAAGFSTGAGRTRPSPTVLTPSRPRSRCAPTRASWRARTCAGRTAAIGTIGSRTSTMPIRRSTPPDTACPPSGISSTASAGRSARHGSGRLK